MSRRALFLCFLTAVLLKPLIGHSQAARRGAGPPAQAAAARVTFAETIAPIVYANCVTCHRPGEAAPFPLISYEDVAKRGALIAKVTESRYMPPWHAEPGYGEFVGERRLTDAQIATLGAWVKQGMPRGDDARMPRLPEFPPDGWRLGQPDLILEMPVAFEVPAGGPDVFRNFVIPTKTSGSGASSSVRARARSFITRSSRRYPAAAVQTSTAQTGVRGLADSVPSASRIGTIPDSVAGSPAHNRRCLARGSSRGCRRAPISCCRCTFTRAARSSPRSR